MRLLVSRLVRTVVGGLLLACVLGGDAFAQAPFRKIGQLDLTILGLTAAPEQSNPVVPKNTASGLRVDVLGGNGPVAPADVTRFLGAGVHVEAELSGPGLGGSVTLGLSTGQPLSADPLLLSLPALTTAGDYSLSNLRLMAGGRVVLDVTPSRVPLKVIDQVLITSVKTRPLTLQEILDKGIVLDKKDYFGFEFTLGVTLESKAVTVRLPVVFDRQGVIIPIPVASVSDSERQEVSLPDLPPIIPMMLNMDPGVQAALAIKFPDGGAPDIKIPALLVIPGNVGYLKQFFSAQLFVANGAPGGSGLVVRDVTGTIQMPVGADGVAGTDDDPLALPDTQHGPQPATMPVRALGPDGLPGTADDVSSLNPGEQAQAEFLLRGEKEGFHTINFAIDATLEGLPIGPVHVTGKASGGVLVRNPFFDLSFAVPSVVRKGQSFKLGVTVNNIGQGAANNVSVSLDASRMSGVTLQGDATRQINTLKTGDAVTLSYDFVADRTGQVVATYLHFDPGTNAGGEVSFTLGIGDRGVALSPDTFVLPTVADALPGPLVDAALRALGQAWSVANAQTLPSGVLPIARNVVTRKAQALAEAGLRVTLGETLDGAVRDLGFDFFGANGHIDDGFDQLLRQTDAGQAFTAAFGAAMAAPIANAGGLTAYHDALARLSASGPDQISFGLTAGAPIAISVADAAGHTATRTLGDPSVASVNAIRSAALVPVGSTSVLGVITDPSAGPYTLMLQSLADTNAELAVALPRGDGTIARADAGSLMLAAGVTRRIVLDTAQADALRVEQDLAGDGEFTVTATLTSQTLAPAGATLVSATMVGPEAVEGASDRGFSLALLFDRPVDSDAAKVTDHYTIPANTVASATTQLSGRLVFASLLQPEGPYVPSSITIDGLADSRQAIGPPAAMPLGSRLLEPGAVINGHVVNADGTPIPSAPVIYSNQYSERSGLAILNTDARGQFQFRYVVADPSNNLPWFVIAQDPSSGAQRWVSGWVRAAGEQIIVDIAMSGRGTVTGVVRDLNGVPVGGATVAVIDQLDPQLSGGATTDGDGRYSVYGVGVGAVSVSAGKGLSIGHSSGRLDRAGTTTTVNVTMDGGVVSVSGTLRRDAGGVLSPVAGANVVYRVNATYGLVPIAVVQTDVDGHYAFTQMPVGSYQIDVALDSRDTASISGVAAANDDLRNRDLLIEVTNRAHVRGTVKYPDGTPMRHQIVSIADRGVFTNDDGSFDIPDVPVQVGVNRDVNARLQDESRYATVRIQINDATPPPVTMTLSALGNAQFTVLDALGHPVAGQRVELLVPCASSCPCAIGILTTDIHGVVLFRDLKLGAATARALSVTGTFIDVAEAKATVPGEGQTGYGVLRFGGTGSVTGVVLMPDGTPAVGALLTLRSNVYSTLTCNLDQGDSHQIQTTASGGFNLIGVNVGPVGVTATHPFLPTTVGAQGTLTHDGDSVDFTLRLVDTTAGELSGTVYLANGTTRAGAGVEVSVVGMLPAYTIHTDDNGHFAFAKILPTGTYMLSALDPVTGGVAQEVIYLPALRDSVHDLRFKSRATVRVRVVDGAGQPIDHALVTLNEQTFPHETFDGAIEPANEGVIAFDRVIEGAFYVEVQDPHGRGGRGYGVVPQADAAGAVATVDLKVRLTVTGNISGHFFQPDGVTPIPFATVTLTAGGTPTGRANTAGSGDVGSFAFDFVPAGPVRLEAQDPLTARTGIAVGTIDTDGQLLALDVVAQGLGTVQGLVTSNGAPQPGAHVTVVSGTFNASLTTDAEGRYVLPGVPEGRVVVTVSLDAGFLSGTLSQTLSGDGTVVTMDVPLHDSGVVDGVVLESDGVTIAPPSLVSVQVGGPGGLTLTGTSDVAGHFHFDRVPAGLVTIKADVLGSIDLGATSVEVPAAGEVQASLVLNGIGSIAGTAVDSVGQPVEGELQITGAGAFAYTVAAHVNPDGVFRFPEVIAEPFTASLTASAGSLVLYGRSAGVVAPGAETTLTVALENSGTIAGAVVRTDGTTPAFGANVTVRLVYDGRTVAVQAQQDGRFTVRGVPLGDFTIVIDDPLTTGVGRVGGGHLDTNGQSLDVGTVVLDDSVISVVSISPADGATSVTLNTPIVIVLTDPVSSTGGIYVRDSAGGNISAYAAISADGKTVTVLADLPEASDVTVQVSTALSDVYGRHPWQTVISHLHTVDVTPPSVATIAPANLAIQVSGTTAITATFSEPLAAATDVASLMSLTGLSGAVAGTTVLTSPTVAVFTPASPLPANASYTVTANGAVDASGNRQTAAFHSVFATPDTAPPVLTLDSPVAGSFIVSRRPRISVSFIDAASGPNAPTATLSVDGTPVTPQRYLNYVYFDPLADLADGVHTVQSTVADRAGNLGSASFSFTVDSLPPSVPVITGVSEGQHVSGTITLGVTSTDAGSGVARIDLFANQFIYLGSIEPPATTLVVDTRGLNQGAAALTAHAYDALGNGSSYSAPLTVVVDKVPLTMFFNAPAANTTFRDTVIVSVTTSEPVDHVTVTIGPTTVLATWYAGLSYYAAVPLAAVPEGTATATATAYGLLGEVVAANVAIVVDRSTPVAVGLPTFLSDGNNFYFQIQPDGSLIGTNGVYQPYWGGNQNASLLDVVSGGVATRFTGATTGTAEQNQQQIVVQQDGLGGLTVTRKIFVPRDGYFARYVELFSNPTADPITVDVRLTSYVRQAGNQRVFATSSGDPALSVADPATADRWVVAGDSQAFDPAGSYSVPSLAFAFDGPGARASADVLAFTDETVEPGRLTYQWSSATVPAGGSVAYLHFDVQQATMASSTASAERLAQLPPEALVGLTPSDIAAIRNFAVPGDGIGTVAPLKLGGSISGHVYAADGSTPAPGANVRIKSVNPLFALTNIVLAAADGSFALTQSVTGVTHVVVPREDFTLSAQYINGVISPTTTGTFAPDTSAVVADVVFTNAAIVRGAVRRHTGAIVALPTRVYVNSYPFDLPSSNTYVFPVVPPGAFSLTAYSYHPQGDQLSALQGFVTGTLAAGEVRDVDVVLAPTGGVSGIVTAGGGAPAQFAFVQIAAGSFRRTTNTDASGGYLLTDVPVGSYTLTVTQYATGITADPAAIAVSVDQTTNQNVAFPGKGTVTALVVFPTGALATNVQVSILGPGITSQTRFTDANGRATFGNVVTGRVYTLRAFETSTGIYSDATGMLTTDGQSVTTTVVLPAHATVRVTVVTPNGAPFPNATIYISYAIGRNPYGLYSSGTADGSGVATIGNIPEGAFAVYVYDPAGGRDGGTATGTITAADQGATVSVQVVLPFVASVQGHVYAGDGHTPLQGFPVQVVDPSNGNPIRSTYPNVQGFYSLSNISLAASAFEIRVLSPAGETMGSRSLTISVDGETLTADFTVPIAFVTGHVTFADGTPVPYPSVVATQNDASGVPRTFYADSNDEAGNYSILGIAVGAFTLTAQDYGSGLTGTGAGQVIDVSSTTTADVSLQPSGSVQGVLRDANGNPMPSAYVYADSSGLAYSRYTTTDDQGTYRLDNIALGQVTVTAYTDVLSATGQGTLASVGQLLTVDLTLPPTGTITGTVRDNGVPVVATFVYFEDEFGINLTSVTIDANGAYVNTSAVAGPTRGIALSDDGLQAGFAETVVPVNGTATLDITFGNAAYPYSGLTLAGSDGFLYRPNCELSLSSGGTVDGRLISPYSAAYTLSVGGVGTPCRFAWLLDVGGRQLTMGPVMTGALSVTRKLFVPSSGGFARYVDALTNRTAAAVTVDVEVAADLASADGTRVVAAPQANTFYAVTDNGGAPDQPVQPVLAHVFGGAGANVASVAPSATHFAAGDGHISYRWTLTIPAGSTVSLMHFAVQRDATDQSGALAAAQALGALADADALAGLSPEERARIVNFVVP